MAEFPLPDQSRRTVQFTVAFEFDNPNVLPILREKQAIGITRQLRRDTEVNWMIPEFGRRTETDRCIGKLTLHTLAMDALTDPVSVLFAGAGHVYDLLDEYGIEGKQPLYVGVRTQPSEQPDGTWFEPYTLEVSTFFNQLESLGRLQPEDFADGS